MKAQVVSLVCLALVAAGCGGGGGGDSGRVASNSQVVPAVAAPGQIEPNLVSSVEQGLNATGATPVESVYTPSPAGVVEFLKQEDTLWFAGSSGLVAMTRNGTRVVKDEPISAAVYFASHLWVATEGALATVDGLVTIVPEFATAFTSLAVYGDELYAGTAGDGVWKVEAGRLVPVSEEWFVKDLVATESELYAATDKGLFSYQDDRWHARRLDDTSAALNHPVVLYSRYPYLYVGTDSDLLRYDGGRWEPFGLNTAVSALGWHDAKLYVGTAAGTLLALDGGLTVTVPSPVAGAITAIVRFDGRLHVATEEGVYRLRHGRFEKIDWDVPAESEPKHEPIAFLL